MLSMARSTLTTITHCTRRAHIHRRANPLYRVQCVSPTLLFALLSSDSRRRRPYERPRRRGGSGDRNELAASTSRAYTPTQAYAARRALRRLAGGHAHPEILMRLIEERVSVQVNDFANLESVCKARAVGRNNLKVHRLLYELETSRPRDPKIRSSRGLEYEKGDKKSKMTDLHESR